MPSVDFLLKHREKSQRANRDVNIRAKTQNEVRMIKELKQKMSDKIDA